MRGWRGLMAGVALFSSAVSAGAFQNEELPVARAFAAVRGGSPVPIGWVHFCRQYASECEDRYRAPEAIHLTPEVRRQLEEVNSLVNRTIVAVTDLEHLGVADRWDLPNDGKGDCEDMALLKRKMLIAAGFPRQALLMTVVWDHAGNGHAVLMAHTTEVDLVLDNLNKSIVGWAATGYTFVKRQSEENEQDWVYLEEKGRNVPLVASK
jgi:predicted transglutaminase-like cysteine proteinase